MKNNKGGVGLLLVVYLALIILATVGWVKNLVYLTRLDFKAPYKAEVIRTVGLFPAVGAITGYINIQD